MKSFSLALLLILSGEAGQGAVAQPLATPTEQMKEETDRNSVGTPVIVEDERATAKNRIALEAATLLKQRNYRALDALADQLRQDTRTFAQGDWPIAFLYSGVVDLPKEATETEWQSHIESLRGWFKNDPDCGTPRVALARGLLEYAWQARGDGWASSVTSEGRRLYGERISEARRILNAAAPLAQNCPVYYSSRLKVALADSTSRERYEALFNEAIKAFPTYATFYLAKSDYLLPRWFGKEGEWEAFAAASADRLGAEAGDMLYAQIVWAMHDHRFFGNILKETAVEWQRIAPGFEALCRRYPNSISAPSEYCYLAGFHPKTGRGLSRDLFLRLGNRCDLSVWKTTERWTSDRAFAFGGK